MFSFCASIQVGFVTDTRNTQDAGMAVPGHDRLRYRGHAHSISPDGAQETEVGRRFERWAGKANIDTFVISNAFFMNDPP